MMKRIFYFLLFFLFLACGPDAPVPVDKMQLVSVRVGQSALSVSESTMVESVRTIVITFSKPVDPVSISGITLTAESMQTQWDLAFSTADQNKQIVAEANELFPEGADFVLTVPNTLKGEDGAAFDGISFRFEIEKKSLEIVRLEWDGTELSTTKLNTGIDLEPAFQVLFSHDVPLGALQGKVLLNGDKNYTLQFEELSSNLFTIRPEETLPDYTKLNLFFSSTLGDAVDRDFEYARYELFTRLDSTPDFPLISDEELLTLVQEQTFKYFWDFGHPVSGMARERNTSGNTVTSGGSGFGLMAIIVGVERGFITREEAVARWEQIVGFLEAADRFHGAWAHWMDGNTGRAIPFSQKDNGGDLVETAFLVQGLLTVRQFLDSGDPVEAGLISRIDFLWNGVEWSWYTRGGQKVLYWHWSPEYDWQMNLPIRGHNETQIVYVLAAASKDFSIDRETYENGYARNGAMVNGKSYYGIELPLGYDYGGPLFFSHYSYLGLDPRNLEDQYASYWQQNTAHTLINRAHCVANPNRYTGYSVDCWGLTASDNDSGYSAHSPTNDRGVITPTAAISSIPYTPEESLAAIRHFYFLLGDRLWGEYGFYDAFNFSAGWVASSYLAIDQGPIVCMIENYRSGLLWDLFMSAPEVQSGLDKLGFTY
jgi:hypothetical protein